MQWTIKLSVSPDKTQIACGSMVLFLSFSRKSGSKSQIFVKKIWDLPPCRRRNSLAGQ